MSQVLLIEPDKMLAKTYEAALLKDGHKVKVASTSQAAIYLADDVLPDIVIIEIQLVSHSGIEFLYEFRSYPDWQGIPVLMHTQVPYIELKDGWQILTKQLGVSEYAYKPETSLEGLIRSVNKLSLKT